MGKIAPSKSVMEVEKTSKNSKIKKRVVKKIVMPNSLEQRIEKIIKPQQKNKIIPNKSELFKSFQKSVSDKFELPQKAHKGRKDRLMNKNRVLKKKLLTKFLAQTKQKSSDVFLLESLRENLGEFEEHNVNVPIAKVMTQQQKLKQSNEDLSKMRQVFQINQFIQNPLATMKLHLENTYKQKHVQ